MNLQILSAMLEDHLTNEDIQEAQALLEWTYEEMVDIRCQLSKAQAEIDALKSQNAELLAAQEGTQCKHKFHVDAGGVLFCVYCSASFSEQQQAIAKARGE